MGTNVVQYLSQVLFFQLKERKSCSSGHFLDGNLLEEVFHSPSLFQYTHGNVDSYHQMIACMMYPGVVPLFGSVSASYSDVSMRKDCCWYPVRLFDETMCLT
jgi:hypothetical protein